MVVMDQLKTLAALCGIAVGVSLGGCAAQAGEPGEPAGGPETYRGAHASRATPSQARTGRVASVEDAMAQRTDRKRATPSQRRPVQEEQALHAEVTYDFFGKPRSYDR